MASQKIVNLAASCFGGGLFQPLFDPNELSDRDLRLINQAQFLIIHQNTSRERLSRNWADEINYNLTSFVSNEEIEALRNSRDARRRQESEDQLRTRHSDI